MRSPISILCSGLNKSGDCSLSFYVLPSRPFHHLCSPLPSPQKYLNSSAFVAQCCNTNHAWVTVDSYGVLVRSIIPDSLEPLGYCCPCPVSSFCCQRKKKNPASVCFCPDIHPYSFARHNYFCLAVNSISVSGLLYQLITWCGAGSVMKQGQEGDCCNHQLNYGKFSTVFNQLLPWGTETQL